MRYPDVSTKEQVLEMQLQIDELNQQLSDWRNRLSWQEEIAFFALKTEELARRLSTLEKRLAHQHQNEAEIVQIRFHSESLSDLAG